MKTPYENSDRSGKPDMHHNIEVTIKRVTNHPLPVGREIRDIISIHTSAVDKEAAIERAIRLLQTEMPT